MRLHRAQFQAVALLALIAATGPTAAQYACDPYVFGYTCPISTDEAASSAATSVQVLRTATTLTSSMIGSRIASALRDRQQSLRISATGEGVTRASAGHQVGLAAGDQKMAVGAWAGYSLVDTENDLSSTAYDSTLNAFTGGVDVSLRPNLLVGLALGYDTNDLDTTFNRGEQDIDGFTVAPYVGYLLTPNLSVDASVGYTARDIDQFRTLPGTATRVTGSLDSDTLFASAHLNWSKEIDPWYFTIAAGYLWAREDQDGFTESDGTVNRGRSLVLGHGSLRGDVAYAVKAWEPFAFASLVHDFSAEKIAVGPGQAGPANDRTAVQMGLGIRYFADNGLTSALELATEQGRDDFDTYSVNFSLRMGF